MKKLTKIETNSFRGGNITRNEPALLPVGGFSKIQNMRQRHPGLEQRGGMSQLHTTATAAKILSAYQFSKGKKTERHMYTQRSDDDVWEATADPPTVTTGAFGTKVFTGSASSVPASWSVMDETLFFSNGVDQHQIYPGTASYVKRLIVYKGATAIPTVPILGEDYSDEVSDGLTTTVAVLDSLSTLAAYDCIFIMTPVPVHTFTWTISKANDTASVAQMKYRKSDDTWEPCAAFADTTKDAGSSTKTLATTGGTMKFTLPDSSIPFFMFGQVGYWHQLSLASGALDAETEVTSVTYETDWQGIENVWDGVEIPVVETQHCTDATAVYKKFGSTAIEIDSMTDAGKVYFATADPINAIYVDPGAKPNTTGTTTIDAMYYWTGAAFSTVGTVSDGSSGMSKPGWVTFPRKAAFKTAFNSGVYAYWYYFEVDKTLNDDVIISLSYQPYFKIADHGTKGVVSSAWKNRMVYGFGDRFLFASALHRPQVLNGYDGTGVLEAGDGRDNKVICAKPFNNELMAWQEEKGKEGGCLTLFEGYSPPTFGKLVLSTEIGILNSKCAVVIDGSRVGTPTDQVITKIAFWVSHKGVFMSDGRYVTDITGDIKNYFNPQESECIRRGYDNDHWMSDDPSENTINLGIVVGISVQTSTATSTTGDKLVDTAGAFSTRKSVTGHPIAHTIAVGDTVYNTTDSTSALITAIDSATTLSIDTDIMASGEGYEIYSATCNLFPVYDLEDGTWSFDSRTPQLACMANVEAASGNNPILQVGGGVADGFTYLLNTTTNDVSAAIDAYTIEELSGHGMNIFIGEGVVRTKVQTAGDLTLTPSINSIAQTVKTLSMTAEVTNQTIRRHRENFNLTGQHITMKYQNNTVSQTLYLLDRGHEIQEIEGQ